MTEKIESEFSTILVVDDDPDILDLLEDILTLEGFQTVKAGNGEEALELFAKTDIGLVVTDLKMPKIDGFQLVESLRVKDPHLPIIVVSGYEDAIDRFRDTNLNILSIEKPIDSKWLLSCVKTLFSQRENQVAEITKRSGMATRKIAIVGNFGLKKQLTNIGYTLLEVNPSKESLAALLIDNDPDCIIIDMDADDYDGAELCQFIKAELQDFSVCPILITSFEKGFKSAMLGIKAGADDCLVVPCNASILKRKLFSLIRIKELTLKVRLLERREAIQNMIVTYNHEFNNPLAVAITNIQVLKDNPGYKNDSEAMETLLQIESALDKIHKNVKTISKLSSFDCADYDDETKMIRI